MKIDTQIKVWANIVESQINEISDVDVDQETWRDDMGRADDRFDNEFVKGTNERYTKVLDQIEKQSEGTKVTLISWLMSLLEGSFDTKVEFEKKMEQVLNNRVRRFNTKTMPQLYKDILETIGHSIGEMHYQNTAKSIERELDEDQNRRNIETLTGIIEDVVSSENYKATGWGIEDNKDWMKGYEIAKNMTKDEIDSFLIDYSRNLYNLKNKIDFDDNNSIKEFKRYTVLRLSVLWFWFFPFLHKNNLTDVGDAHSGSSVKNILDYIENIGGPSYRDFEKVFDSIRIHFPSNSDMTRYLRSGHRTI